jgi:hypothetical protein
MPSVFILSAFMPSAFFHVLLLSHRAMCTSALAVGVWFFVLEFTPWVFSSIGVKGEEPWEDAARRSLEQKPLGRALEQKEGLGQEMEEIGSFDPTTAAAGLRRLEIAGGTELELELAAIDNDRIVASGDDHGTSSSGSPSLREDGGGCSISPQHRRGSSPSLGRGGSASPTKSALSTRRSRISELKRKTHHASKTLTKKVADHWKSKASGEDPDHNVQALHIASLDQMGAVISEHLHHMAMRSSDDIRRVEERLILMQTNFGTLYGLRQPKIAKTSVAKKNTVSSMIRQIGLDQPHSNHSTAPRSLPKSSPPRPPPQRPQPSQPSQPLLAPTPAADSKVPKVVEDYRESLREGIVDGTVQFRA